MPRAWPCVEQLFPTAVSHRLEPLWQLRSSGIFRKGLNRSGVDPPLSSSHACLTIFRKGGGGLPEWPH